MLRIARIIMFFALLAVFASPETHAQFCGWKKKAKEFREELNEHYRDPDRSPLTEEDRKDFKELDFFPIEKDFCVNARVELTPDAEPFEMPTASGKTKTFRKYAVLHFRMKGKDMQVSVYQNLKLIEKEKYKDNLFLPFKDLSSGNESYGGGRYIDLKIPKNGRMKLDFNQCYNPYCAYSDGWNCPIPPEENSLDVKILAGVRKWDKKH